MKYLALIVLLVLMLFPIHAQDESSTDGWPITTRCLPATTTPPDDWTFPGTILIKGKNDWLHAVNSQLDTPYILSQNNHQHNALSPDGRHYATVVRSDYLECDAGTCATVWIKELVVYDTVNNTQLVIDWPITYFLGHWGYSPQIWWYDHQHLVYIRPHTEWAANGPPEYVMLDITTGTYEPFAQTTIPRYMLYDFISPDWTQLITLDYHGADSGTLYSDTEETKLPDLYKFMSWSHDSGHFAAITAKPRNDAPLESDSIVIFDRDGTTESRIISIQNYQDAYRTEASWSPDDNYLAFYLHSLHIADMRRKTVTDTCVSLGKRESTWSREPFSVAWSPDGTQLAYIEDRRTLNPVRVIDLERWQQYTVAYHEGAVVGWADDPPDETIP